MFHVNHRTQQAEISFHVNQFLRFSEDRLMRAMGLFDPAVALL